MTDRSDDGTPEGRAPLFILAPPRSYTSLVNAVIGQHPQAYGLPELNLFMAGTMRQFWEGTDEDGDPKAIHWPLMRHGLLRTVAQLYSGEQTIDTIDMAYRWIMVRAERTTGEVYRELCAKLAPRLPVEKSPGYLRKPIYLERLRNTFPDARFIHLIRHPIGQGESVLKTGGGKLVLRMLGSVDRYEGRAFPDPQFLWYDAHAAIMDFLDDVPGDRWLRILGEDFLRDMDAALERICDWLGFPCGEAELAAMRRTEDSPYACVGPATARLGNDINFLEDPKIRSTRIERYDLLAPLSWRPDHRHLFEEVIEMAKDFGYD